MIRIIAFFLVSILLTFYSEMGLSQRGQYQRKTKKNQFYGNQRLREPLFKWVTGNHSRHGIQLSFGPAYTFTSTKERMFELERNDSIFQYSEEAKSRIGAFIEIGMVHITKKPRKFIQYYDWGLGLKYFGGREVTRYAIHQNETLLTSGIGEGEFYNGHLYGRFSVHNVWQINPQLFLDNALGVNGDYLAFGKNKAYDGFSMPSNQQFQGDIFAQLHYTLGIGIKPKNGFFIIPGVTLPFLGIQDWDRGKPTFNWFSSSYYPVQFQLKLVWLFKRDPNRCPAVETNEQDRERAKQYQNR